MSDLKPLREALAGIAERYVDPFTDEAAPINRALYDYMAQPSTANAAIMGYRSRQPEIDALAASHARLLEALTYVRDRAEADMELPHGLVDELSPVQIKQYIEQAIAEAEKLSREGV